MNGIVERETRRTGLDGAKSAGREGERGRERERGRECVTGELLVCVTMHVNVCVRNP